MMGKAQIAVLFLLSYSGPFVCLTVNSLAHAPPLLFPSYLYYISLFLLSPKSKT